MSRVSFEGIQGPGFSLGVKTIVKAFCGRCHASFG